MVKSLMLCGLAALAHVTAAQRPQAVIGGEFAPLNYCATVGAADFDLSGRVDVSDILSVISAHGESGGANDLDQSGAVDVNDVLEIIGYHEMDTTECLDSPCVVTDEGCASTNGDRTTYCEQYDTGIPDANADGCWADYKDDQTQGVDGDCEYTPENTCDSGGPETGRRRIQAFGSAQNLP